MDRLIAAAKLVPVLADEAARYSDQLLRDARDLVPAEIPVTTRLSSKPIRAALATEFERAHHDLVVMGSRSHGVIVTVLRRSVSRFVLDHSPVPVLVIHVDSIDAHNPAPASRRWASGRRYRRSCKSRQSPTLSDSP